MNTAVGSTGSRFTDALSVNQCQKCQKALNIENNNKINIEIKLHKMVLVKFFVHMWLYNLFLKVTQAI